MLKARSGAPPHRRAPKLAVGCGLLAILLCGCGGGPTAANVLLISFDTVRADSFGCYGSPTAHTPNVDRLAADGMLFSNCLSPVPITLPAHASMLTGRYPHSHGSRLNGDSLSGDELTLAEILKAEGWDTAAFVSAEVLRARYGLAQGFATYDDDLPDPGPAWSGERVAHRTASRAGQWLESRGRGPFFLWLHFFDPHQPYRPPAQWASRFPDDPYADEIAYADDALAAILGRVDLERTLVVFAGDHGESLGEHGELTHSFFAYSSTLHIPLVISFPDGRHRGRRVAQQSSLVDILPTVLDFLGLAVPASVDGRSLLAAIDSPADDHRVYFESLYPLVFGWSPLSGLRSREWHYVEAPRPELYRLAEDPGETSNVIEAHPAAARELAAEIAAIAPFMELEAGDGGAPLTAAERRRLNALGYVVEDIAARELPLDQLPDPKDRIRLYSKLSAADTLGHDGHFQDATALLEDILQQEPGLRRARLLLASFLAEWGRHDEAIAHFERLTAAGSADPETWRIYALSLIDAGMPDRAISVLDQALQSHPGEPELWDLEGVAHRMAGDTMAAVDCAERAVQLAPGNATLLNNLGAALLARRDYGAARQQLKRAVSIRPDNPQALLNLGSVELELGEHQSAQRRLEALLEQDPENFEALLQLNKALILRRRLQEAIEVSRRALAIRPDDPDAGYLLGLALYYDRSYREAEQQLRAVVAAHPTHVAAYERLCEALLDQEPPRAAEAQQLLERAGRLGLRLSPEIAARVYDASSRLRGQDAARR